MTPNERDEPARDAWLSAALRHAPDALAAPPKELSEAILRQARAATAAPMRSAERARPPNAWAAAWSWLARPPVAAGFASVMVATLVGLMWWDRPMDEALPRPPAPVAQEPAEPPPVAADAEPTAPGRSAPAAAPEAVKQRDSARGPAPLKAPAPERKERSVPSPFSDDRKSAPAAPRPPADMSAESARALTLPPAAAPPARAREVPAPSPSSENATPAARDETAPAARAAQGALAVGPVAKAAPPPLAAARSLTAPLRQDSAAPRPAALAELLSSVAAQAQRWTWQRGGDAQAMTPALQRWLLQFDAATSTRWQAADPAARPGAGSSLRLIRDGSLQATLQLDDTGAWVTPAASAGGASRAALPQDALATLTRALDDAAP